MLTRLLLVGVFAGAVGGGILGQTGSVPFDWASLVGGAVGSSPAAVVLAWRLNKADKEVAGLREELRDMHTQTIVSAEKTAIVLVDATRLIADVKTGMEATLSRRVPDIDQTLQRVESTLRDIARDRRGQR
jgi:hypothetical protein